MKLLFPLLMIVGLASCGEDRLQGPSAEQASQLNETEELLNEMADEDSSA